VSKVCINLSKVCIFFRKKFEKCWAFLSWYVVFDELNTEKLFLRVNLTWKKLTATYLRQS